MARHPAIRRKDRDSAATRGVSLAGNGWSIARVRRCDTYSSTSAVMPTIAYPLSPREGPSDRCGSDEERPRRAEGPIWAGLCFGACDQTDCSKRGAGTRPTCNTVFTSG